MNSKSTSSLDTSKILFSEIIEKFTSQKLVYGLALEWDDIVQNEIEWDEMSWT